MLPPRGSDEARLQHKEVEAGLYKIVFKPKEYFKKTDRKCFYPWVEVRSVYYYQAVVSC
jgi:5-hydroxyisourate hydrolase